MKIGILTFQFAKNYGAMLQAFSLKKYIIGLGYYAEIIPYYPEVLRKAYSINPFDNGINIKNRVGRVIRYHSVKSQDELFLNFKEEKLYVNNSNEIYDATSLEVYLKQYDCIIYGSDQIWNTDINFNDPIYFGNGADCKKIAYAASMGCQRPKAKQSEFIKKFLPSFSAISVREPVSKKILKDVCDLDAEVVCDPVFLTTENEWKSEEKYLKVKPHYVLVYELQNNDNLTNLALAYAEKNNLPVYSIHPTNSIFPKGTIPLKKVGPGEFLYLIDHADAVCTNSFHCVAFSIIYKKKLFHIPNSHSPERTLSILKRVGIKSKGKEYKVKPEDYNFEDLNGFIANSKSYATKSLKDYKNNEVD